MTLQSGKPHKVTGVAYWTFLDEGSPGKAFDDGEFEWGLDLALDEIGLKKVSELGLSPKVVNKGDDRGDFIKFRRATVKKGGPKTGEPNPPVNVYGPDGKDFDTTIKIGNGSRVQVTFNVYQNTYKGKILNPKPAILDVKILELVEYVPLDRDRSEDEPPTTPKMTATTETFA